QQIQPLIAITLAWVVLKEKRKAYFWPLAALALISVYMVVFARDPGQPWSALQQGRLTAGLLAAGAAALWASGTVLGRYALGGLSVITTTALRFILALPLLAVITLLTNGVSGFRVYSLSTL